LGCGTRKIGELGKTTMHHIQNWNSIASIYAQEGYWRREKRNTSISYFGPFYRMAEHSIVQWALALREEDPALSELAVLLLKLIWQCDYTAIPPTNVMATAFSFFQLLWREGEKEEPVGFSKRVLLAMEEMDWEDQLSAFDYKVFDKEFLRLLKSDSVLLPDFGRFFA
jgi:hypothetical protein